MSKHETWRTRKYWKSVGGLLIEEFEVVRGDHHQGRRVVDGLIVRGEETRIHPGNTYDIKGKDVIVIQTKKTRIGMYLLGQAYFSKFLVEPFKPNSIKFVAICGKDDAVIGNLAKEHGVEVVVIGDQSDLKASP